MFHGRLDKATAKGLALLRERIAAAKIPPSRLDESINLATWNIRDFGRKRRSAASIHYIAEIVWQFDLLALIELRANLGDLARVMKILGPHWRVVLSDFGNDRGANQERVGFLYDERSVTFTGLAAEADPPSRKDEKTGEYVAKYSWWRSPYMASFRAGNFDFVLIAAHIRWGSGAPAREKPLGLFADWIHKRSRNPNAVDKDIIVVGDFNIPRRNHYLYDAITKHGLSMPSSHLGIKGTNLEQKKRYDQILHYPFFTKSFTNKGGILDFYAGDMRPLYAGSGRSNKQLTYELSDHLPLWVQIDTDVADEELDQVLDPRAYRDVVMEGRKAVRRVPTA